MTERKLAALVVVTFLGLAAISGGTTFAVLSDQESVSVTVTAAAGNVAAGNMAGAQSSVVVFVPSQNVVLASVGTTASTAIGRSPREVYR